MTLNCVEKLSLFVGDAHLCVGEMVLIRVVFRMGL